MNKLVEAIANDLMTPRAVTEAVVGATLERLDGRHGWKLVPVNTTDEIREVLDEGRPWIEDFWKALLAASPDPSAK